MKILLSLFLVFTGAAHATTKALLPNTQASQNYCELRAKFLGARGVKLSGGQGREAKVVNAVYWDLEVLEDSGAFCPKDSSVALRVRAADFKVVDSGQIFTYPVEIIEPGRDEVFRVKTSFVEGTDTFLNRKYSEWIFAGRIND